MSTTLERSRYWTRSDKKPPVGCKVWVFTHEGLIQPAVFRADDNWEVLGKFPDLYDDQIMGWRLADEGQKVTL